MYWYLFSKMLRKSHLVSSLSSLTVKRSDRNGEMLLCSLKAFAEELSATILNPSFGVIEKAEVTYNLFSCTSGNRNESKSGGLLSTFLKTSHIPFSAATVNGPFLKTNSPTSLQT